MSIKRTVKYHVPQRGLYMYAQSSENVTELIVLNSTDSEQTLVNEHIQKLLKDRTVGKEISSGKMIDLKKDMVIPANKSVIIECRY